MLTGISIGDFAFSNPKIPMFLQIYISEETERTNKKKLVKATALPMVSVNIAMYFSVMNKEEKVKINTGI